MRTKHTEHSKHTKNHQKVSQIEFFTRKALVSDGDNFDYAVRGCTAPVHRPHSMRAQCTYDDCPQPPTSPPPPPRAQQMITRHQATVEAVVSACICSG